MMDETAITVDGADRRKSIGFLTREVLPRIDNFRRSFKGKKRPSIGELRGDPQSDIVIDNPQSELGHSPLFKLGWIQGSMIPVMLNIYGVMLFLRMGWIVAEAGVLGSIAIIILASIICLITTLSLSAICTNGEVRGGGIYYLISRSLGPEFGAAVGVVFAFANSVSASLNAIGFCLSLQDLLNQHNIQIIDGGINDIRLVGTIAVIIMVFICATGMEWEVKAQNFLIAIISAAIIDFMVGVIMGPHSDADIARGFTGLKVEVLEQNLYPAYRYSEGINQSIFTVFAIFFPSVTGIQAAANICGDLKNPASAIPKGTLLALLITMLTYVTFVILVGFSALRDASGLVGDVTNHTFPYHFACAANASCEFGLYNNYSMMNIMSPWEWLIYAGCFAATLSTSLTNILSVPRLIQSLGWDRIFPGVHFFSKGYGKNGEPYRGYVLCGVVSIAFVLIADLNTVAPLITNFYLVAYALINFCTFHAAYVQPLGWRPSFRFYNKWLSLIICIVCIAIMFFLSWASSVITIGLLTALYWVVLIRQPDVNWGSSTQEQTYRTMLSAIFRLQHTGEHIKNFHPQVLALTGNPSHRSSLVDLAVLLTNNKSLLVLGDVHEKCLHHKERTLLTRNAYDFINSKKVKAFYNLIDDIDMETGVKLMIQSSGFGVLTPNIVMMGYKGNWMTCKSIELKSYFNAVHYALVYRMGLCIVRMPSGLNSSRIMSANGEGHHNNGYEMGGEMDVNYSPTNKTTNSKNKLKLSRIPSEIENSLDFFNQKQKKGTIDVYWLYDDGGLTMLLPYLISTRSNWSNCKLRVFALAKNKNDIKNEEQEMAKLLDKLRIKYSSLVIIPEITDAPKLVTIGGHSKLLETYNQTMNHEGVVDQEEIKEMNSKTNIHLRLRELLKENSTKSSLIVMTLPMPRDQEISAPLYMSWLEVLTRGMPPFLLVRGNQSSVLTFYS